MDRFKRFLPHILVIAGFIVIALAYFSPVLKGQVIFQSDIAQYTGMAKEQNDFRAKTGEEPYWTNSSFGGMPTYQLGAKYPFNYVKDIDSILRFLPRPADYLFLYFIGFYVLLLSLGTKPLHSFIGALMFGFSTYLIIILGVGHNAKAHAIAYMPMVLAGVLLVFRKHYVKGGLLTLFAASLEISTNHFQMTYYLLLLLIVVAIYYSILYIKNKDWKGLFVAFAIFIGTGILSIGANATNLMATAEYTQFSTRSNSELTFNPDGTPRESSNAMTYEYITQYSYGIFESLNLLVPRLTGGANDEKLNQSSNLYSFFINLGASPAEATEMVRKAPTYWGDQPGVAAPAYIGAVVFFLFVLSFFSEKRKLKYVFIAGAILSLLLSWGKNFPLLTDIFINYFPLYNKFRAVSSIQTILEMCVPAVAILGLYSFFKLESKEQLIAVKKTGLIAGGILALLFVIKGTLSFSGVNDGYYRGVYGEIGPGFVKALIEDRKAMYSADILRSFIIIALTALVLYLASVKKLKMNYAVIMIGCLAIVDLVSVDRKYVNDTNFVSAQIMKEPFAITEADKEILNDPSHFRVYELNGGFNSARASYYHNSLGGYHAAKPRRMNQLLEYQISNKNYMPVFNMLNVKYIIQQDEQGRDMAMLNPDANGNAWFVSSVKKVDSADEEMKALSSLDTKKDAVFNTVAFSHIDLKNSYNVDSLTSVKLLEYSPNKLVYQSENNNDGLAVFSEVYYPHGWIAKIDGIETPIFSVDYVLRAIELPKGQHKIEFSFEPQVIKTGSRIALTSAIFIILISMTAVAYSIRKNQKKKSTEE